MRNLRTVSALSIVLGALVGCKQEPAAPARPQPVANNSKADDLKTLGEFLKKDAPPAEKSAVLPPGHPPIGGASAPPSGEMPPGHPPMGGDGSGGAGAMPAGHPAVGSDAKPAADAIKFDAPATWKSEPPSSTMRKAQYLIPRAKGDSDDGHMVVYYFGQGQGGTVDMNIARWRGMFSTADGKPVPDSAVTQESKEVAGLKVKILQVTGRFVDPMGTPAGAPQADSLMLSAIIESPQGLWFFKGVGPVATMRSEKDNFGKFVASVRLK